MNIDWVMVEAIAAIAGVLGVIISVFFLVHEVRHNARAIEGATVQSLMTFEREVFQMLIENADLFRRGCEDHTSLSASERFQFDRLVGTQMSLMYSAYTQHERGLIDDDVWQAYLNAFTRYGVFPAYKTIWSNIRLGYPEEMHRAIDEVIQKERDRAGELPWEYEIEADGPPAKA